MNSLYGRASMKPNNIQTRIITEDEYYKIAINPNILQAVNIENSNKIKVRLMKDINIHFNNIHHAIQIVSYSKHIMNKVFTLAQDNDIKIYYTDTDSIHIEYKKIDELSELYKQMYNTELFGDLLGQFKDEFMDKYGCFSTESIYLGKKSYVNKLSNGECHIRMRSIPSNVLEYKCSQDYNNNMLDMYNDLKTNDVEFDLLSCEKRYKQLNNLSIRDYDRYVRILSF
jgi:hypothetical protein